MTSAWAVLYQIWRPSERKAEILILTICPSLHIIDTLLWAALQIPHTPVIPDPVPVLPLHHHLLLRAASPKLQESVVLPQRPLPVAFTWNHLPTSGNLWSCPSRRLRSSVIHLLVPVTTKPQPLAAGASHSFCLQDLSPLTHYDIAVDGSRKLCICYFC